MKQQTFYPEDYDNEIIDEASSFVPAMPSFSWAAKRSAGLMLDQAMLEIEHDKCLALLSKSSMEHIGSLAMMAEQLSNMAPDASQCYRAIVGMYTKQALKRIERW